MADDLAQAREDHASWKKQLDLFFDDSEQMNLQSAITPSESMLGVWLNGPGKSQCGDKPDFATLVSEQEAMHAIVMEVIEAKSDENADKVTEARGRLDAAWAKVDELLGKLA